MPELQYKIGKLLNECDEFGVNTFGNSDNHYSEKCSNGSASVEYRTSKTPIETLSESDNINFNSEMLNTEQNKNSDNVIFKPKINNMCSTESQLIKEKFTGPPSSSLDIKTASDSTNLKNPKHISRKYKQQRRMLAYFKKRYQLRTQFKTSVACDVSEMLAHVHTEM